MNLVNEIKDLKLTYKPKMISFTITKLINNIKVDLNYSTENQYVLDTTDIDMNIVGTKRDFNIIAENNDITQHLMQSYEQLQNASENEELFKDIYKNLDWLTIYICALLDLEHVTETTFYFYKKYAFVKVSFNDGNFETFIHLNIFFNQETDMDELKKDIEPFGQDEINYKQSSDYENCQMITQMFTKDFSKFPFEELYNNILTQNKQEDKNNE